MKAWLLMFSAVLTAAPLQAQSTPAEMTGDLFGVTASIVCPLLLFGGWISAMVWVGRGSTLGRRSRRWGARGLLLGLVAGAAAAAIPAVDWLLGSDAYYLTAIIGSSLGAIVGMLAGSENSSSEGTGPFRFVPS